MDKKKLRELINLFKESGLAKMEITENSAEENYSLKLESGAAAPAYMPAPLPYMQPVQEEKPASNYSDLYAQAGIPAYARADLPVLWLDGEPVFAAGLGIDVRAMSIEGESARRVRFVFAPQKSLWDVQVLPNYADVPEDERRAREAKLKAAAKQFEKNARARRARAAS